ncbi:hypothetical protein ACFSHT_06095 [Paraburkholderia silviterrae]|uniref:Uncharacterized protein n=1 Tax=Paraburkholderia silviterrae TaxID=2528715 RepID=A0A4R5MC45_9BURK|nr:hypothetical protein [Paraburkholderia silviterrae]TDG24478.1 hypothetical protein EYW47_07890 [Paraburkholderia silviterrae]
MKNTLHFKQRKGGNTVQLVRYRYCADRKRSITVTVGSIPIDADPDDVRPFLRLARTTRLHGSDAVTESLTDDDLVLVRAWLLRHGDRRADERRKARDARVERDVLERIRGSGDAGEDPLAHAVTLLPAAGELLLKLSAECQARGQDPWQLLRQSYLSVQAATKEFERLAKEAGITKKRRQTADSESEKLK